MIGKIKGKLIELEGNRALIEIQSGLAYEVFLTPALISTNKIKQSIDIYTFLQVREDAHLLFGFKTKEEKKLFELLLSVSGIGPKIAFTIVSFSQEKDLLSAIKSNDVNYFLRIPGLGRKTALKVILELSHKLDSEFNMEKLYLSEDDKTVLDALMALGFKSPEAKKLLSSLPKELSIENKIKQALKISLPK